MANSRIDNYRVASAIVNATSDLSCMSIPLILRCTVFEAFKLNDSSLRRLEMTKGLLILRQVIGRMLLEKPVVPSSVLDILMDYMRCIARVLLEKDVFI
jgi:hypothetical protein